MRRSGPGPGTARGEWRRARHGSLGAKMFEFFSLAFAALLAAALCILFVLWVSRD